MGDMVGKQGYRGYCTHNEFGGKRIPVPVQNLVMRDYATKNGLLFKLSVNEFFFPDCFLQLGGLLGQLNLLEGVLITSVTMLPGDPSKRYQIYDSFFKNHAELHCVLENVVIAAPGHVTQAEEILQINTVLDQCITS